MKQYDFYDEIDFEFEGSHDYDEREDRLEKQGYQYCSKCTKFVSENHDCPYERKE